MRSCQLLLLLAAWCAACARTHVISAAAAAAAPQLQWAARGLGRHPRVHCGLLPEDERDDAEQGGAREFLLSGDLACAFEEQSSRPPAEADFDEPLRSLPGGLAHAHWLRVGSALCAGGHWQVAAQVARAATQAAASRAAPAGIPLAELFVGAIGACADAGDWKEACRLLRLREEQSSACGGPPEQTEYGDAVRACHESGEWRRASSLLQRARERGVKCTQGMYALAIAGCDAAGRADEALELYALAVGDKVFSHWHQGEAFSLDLHGFSQPTAACAVRYALSHEVGNYLPCDLKIITGRGSHSDDGESKLGPRIERLLAHELSPPLPYEVQERLDCEGAECKVIRNDGCLVVPVQDLFQWLVDSRPFESYVVNIPGASTA